MRRTHYLFLVFLILCSSAQASIPGLSDVLVARRLLNPARWSQVLRIEQSEQNSVYPKSFYALVFEAASVLWLYIPQAGTQSLSHFIGHTEADKSELEPLIHEVLPGMRSWQLEPESSLPKSRSRDIPANACFLQSLSFLEERLRKGYHTEYASLFTFYYRNNEQTRGHTVLLYAREGSTFVVDPADGEGRCYKIDPGTSHKAIARLLSHGQEVIRTREFPLEALLKRNQGRVMAGNTETPTLPPQASPVLASLSWREPSQLTYTGGPAEHFKPGTPEPQSPTNPSPGRARGFAKDI